MSQSLRVLLVGAGSIGYGASGYLPATHLGAFRRHPRCTVVGVVDPSSSRRELVQQETGLPAFPSLDEARDTAPDVISVASPDESHQAILESVLEWHPRAVFCEKPLSTSSDGVERLVGLYESAGIPLSVNFTRRYLPEVQRLTEELEEGRWGPPLAVTVAYTRGLQHNGVHFLDLLFWWFGPPAHLSSGEELLTLVWSSGLRAHFMELPGESLTFGEMDLHCERGRIRLTTQRVMEKSSVSPHPEAPQRSTYRVVEVSSLDHGSALDRAVAAVVASVEEGQPPLTPARDSIVLHHWLQRMSEES